MRDMLGTPLVRTVQKTMADLRIVPGKRILAGVSGGADSMVMLAVIKALGYPLVATHVNFQLRGDESDGDALLVREWCSVNDISYMEYVIDSKQYSVEHQMNVQSAARKIRYDWWESLIKDNQGDLVAMAHHHDDAVETFFINLLRGTGIKGLTGIPVKRDFYIRPLIHVSRGDIESFANEFDIPFRTDSSNFSDDYLRNRVRHHLIPQLRELSPSLGNLMEHSLERIRLEWAAWETVYMRWQNDSVKHKTNGTELKADKNDFPFLLRWLEEKGLPWSLSYDYLNARDAPKGNTLHHEDHVLSRMDGGYFLRKSETSGESVLIPQTGSYSVNDDEFRIEKLPVNSFEINDDPSTVFINKSSVTWPLLIRSIEPGDQFQPFGMHGQTKKLQDFLVDLKFPVHSKSNVRVVLSAGKIIWVAGLRLDESARVDINKDQEIYKLTFRKKD